MEQLWVQSKGLRFTSESRWSSYGSRARDLDSPVRVDGAVMGLEQET